MSHCSHIHCSAPKIIRFLLIDLFLRPLPSYSQLLMSVPWSWLKFKSDCTFFIISLRLWNSLTLSIRSASSISEGCVFDCLVNRLRCQYSNTEIISWVFLCLRFTWSHLRNMNGEVMIFTRKETLLWCVHYPLPKICLGIKNRELF